MVDDLVGDAGLDEDLRDLAVLVHVNGERTVVAAGHHAGPVDKGHVGVVLGMEFKQVGVVKIGDDVAGRDHHIFFTAVVKIAVHVVDSLYHAAKRLAAVGSQQGEVASSLGEIVGAAGADVVGQRQEIALGNNAHVVDARVGHVGEHKVDDAIFAADGNARCCTGGGKLGNLFGKRVREDEA